MQNPLNDTTKMVWVDMDDCVIDIRYCLWCAGYLKKMPDCSPDTKQVWRYCYHCKCGAQISILAEETS